MGCSKSSPKVKDEASSANLASASNLLRVENGARVFYISPDGKISPPSDPVTLNVAQLEGGDKTAFIHANDWFYPLIPGQSQAYKTNYGAYVFPDIATGQQGAMVGLIMPHMPKEEKQQLENVLRPRTVYKQEALEQFDSDPDTADIIALNMHAAATWVSKQVNYASATTETALKNKAITIKEKIRQAEEKHVVDQRLKDGIVYAKDASEQSLKVTDYLVGRLGKATAAVKNQAETQPNTGKPQVGLNAAAPMHKGFSERLPLAIRKRMPKFLLRKNRKGKTPLDGAIQVAGAGADGLGIVIFSLEDAGKQLAKSLATETVDIVRLRYGSEIANVADDTLATAGNVAMTASNARTLGVKGQIKGTVKEVAKNTGKGLYAEAMKQN